jgi:hypothetical protein
MADLERRAGQIRKPSCLILWIHLGPAGGYFGATRFNGRVSGGARLQYVTDPPSTLFVLVRFILCRDYCVGDCALLQLRF